MGRTVTRPVDYEKLCDALKSRGVTSVKNAGPEMGYSEGWCSGPRCNGTISERLIKSLELRFNIKYDEIKPDEPKPIPEPAPQQLTIAPEPQPITVNVNVTADAIAEALVNVMTNQETRNNLVQIVYYAVNKALRNNSTH